MLAFKISLVLHIIGFTMLMAGIFLGLRAGRESSPSAPLLKSIQFGYLLPGTILVLLSGLYQFFFYGAGYYFSQGWFHAKFTFALILVAAGLWLFTALSKVQNSGVALTRKTTAIMHSVVGVLFFAVVAAVIIGKPW